ncbi:OmpW family outer membrane protein [Flammeovirga sp. SubArs3]|uniref:OmpW family outer membrane protein n=1 Tax=Flammeovirga sp. SubArs3 TaxID=2995316 RepID=UPI00248B7453|nr:OmpW family outer membrane protein [Flammeovirga sp. SubArs3]
MKNFKNLLLTISVLLLGATASFAQDNIVGITYSMAVPTTGVNNYINEASFSGVNVEYRKFLNDNLSVGANIGWNYFQQSNGTQTYYGDNGAITGEEFRDSDILQTMVTSHYYFGEEGGIRPYIGVGVGAAGNYFDNQVGGIAVVDHYWSFAVTPEVGVLAPLGGSGTYLLTNVKYNYMTAAKGYGDYGFWSFNIGLAFDF